MTKEKKNIIKTTRYYDGRKKKWHFENFSKQPCTPSVESVVRWINEWENTEAYTEQESALNKLFINLCPQNKELDDILIKVCALNDFYSTNIYSVIDVATAIKDLDIDERLHNPEGDFRIADDINENIKRITGRYAYSFATKYCSHHRPELYPIYDSYVDLLLRFYRDNIGGITFNNYDLLSHEKLWKVEAEFKRSFGLTQFNAKEIDKFLWQEGKACFPKYK